MAELIQGVPYHFTFVVEDVNGDRVSGLTADDFDITVSRRAGGGLVLTKDTAAKWSLEDISGVDPENEGVYEFIYTPTVANALTVISVAENARTLGTEGLHEFSAWCRTAALSATEADAFCTVGDIESLVQRGTFGAETVPNADEVLDMMKSYAAEISAVLEAGGFPYTPATGDNPIPESRPTLITIAQRVNAYGAAAEAIFAFECRSSQTASERATLLWDRYKAGIESLAAYLQSLSIKEGGIGCEVFHGTETAVADLPFRMNTEW